MNTTTALHIRVFKLFKFNVFKSPFGGFRGLLFVFLVSSFALSAQETLIVGQVLNAVDKSPIADVNIFFRDTNIGVKSNEKGYYMIRTQGKETILVFSCVGYRRKEIKIKSGQMVGLDVELQEESTILEDVLVIPGANPALEIMKKVRLMKDVNDVSCHPDYKSLRNEQDLVLLAKINQRSTNKRIYEQLATGSVSSVDSSLTLPLYMGETNYELSAAGKKDFSKNTFSSFLQTEEIVLRLLGEIKPNLNFYENSIALFGKSMISPLSNSGNAYYKFYLVDSISSASGKTYQINFRSKNYKNLAFNGQLTIDSATLALTSVAAALPLQANLNYVQNLSISQKFKRSAQHKWAFDNESLTLEMTYDVLADSLHPKPQIFIHRSVVELDQKSAIDTLFVKDNFAQGGYNADTLNARIDAINQTPALQLARWLADVIITGYVPVGKIDLGKIQQFARITDVEGLRLTLPLRTNEHLWKNVSLGGYAGYGFKNNEVKYSASAQVRIPAKKRYVLSGGYTDDYRRIDYDYNDFFIRENPLVTGDEDIAGTLLVFHSAGSLNQRREISANFSSEWNADVESNVSFRANELASAVLLPLMSNGVSFDRINQQSLTLSTRFSFGERVYDDHLQRIYIPNNKPVVYAVLEGGRYQFANNSGNYAKVSTKIRQFVEFDLGRWTYLLEGGWTFGSVPYTLLEIPMANETYIYKRYQFNLMNYMEYAVDCYAAIHNDLELNGILLNQIPIIKYLHLRELISFKAFYGTRSNVHADVLDLPSTVQPLTTPYMEVGVGVTNILRLLTLQSVWRLTDLNHQGVSPWGLKTSIRISF